VKGEKMANMKRLEKRLENMEKWAKDLERGSGPAQTMENMNWLVSQTRLLGERLAQTEKTVGEATGAIQQNNEILQQFLDKHDMIRDWQVYLEQLQKEAEEEKNALQEQETKSVDARKEAEDGEKVGKGNA